MRENMHEKDKVEKDLSFTATAEDNSAALLHIAWCTEAFLHGLGLISMLGRSCNIHIRRRECYW